MKQRAQLDKLAQEKTPKGNPKERSMSSTHKERMSSRRPEGYVNDDGSGFRVRITPKDTKREK